MRTCPPSGCPFQTKVGSRSPFEQVFRPSAFSKVQIYPLDRSLRTAVDYDELFKLTATGHHRISPLAEDIGARVSASPSLRATSMCCPAQARLPVSDQSPDRPEDASAARGMWQRRSPELPRQRRRHAGGLVCGGPRRFPCARRCARPAAQRMAVRTAGGAPCMCGASRLLRRCVQPAAVELPVAPWDVHLPGPVHGRAPPCVLGSWRGTAPADRACCPHCQCRSGRLASAGTARGSAHHWWASHQRHYSWPVTATAIASSLRRPREAGCRRQPWHLLQRASP